MLAPDVAERLRRLPGRRRVLVGTALRRVADEPPCRGSRFRFARGALRDIAACELRDGEREEGLVLVYALLTPREELRLLLGPELAAAWQRLLNDRYLHGRR